MYDAQTGNLTRVFDSKYKGAPVCFEGGATLKILTVMESGFFGLATADVR